MMELCLLYQQNWCEHSSITVNVRENEWMEVGAWVYENFNMMSGMSFLPYSEHSMHKLRIKSVQRMTMKNY